MKMPQTFLFLASLVLWFGLHAISPLSRYPNNPLIHLGYSVVLLDCTNYAHGTMRIRGPTSLIASLILQSPYLLHHFATLYFILTTASCVAPAQTLSPFAYLLYLRHLKIALEWGTQW